MNAKKETSVYFIPSSEKVDGVYYQCEMPTYTSAGERKHRCRYKASDVVDGKQVCEIHAKMLRKGK